MADNLEPEQEHEQPPQQFRLVVTMDLEGNVRLDGTIGNLFLAYGALELAKDALRQYHREKNAPRIHRPDILPPFGGRNGRG